MGFRNQTYMNTFYFDTEINFDLVKNLRSFLGSLDKSSPNVDFVVDSNGGDVGSSDLIIFTIKEFIRNYTVPVRFLIVGSCDSAMFDIVYALRNLTKIYLGSMATALVHTTEYNSGIPRDQVMAQSVSRAMKQSINDCVNAYKDILTAKQLKMIKKGIDVPIEFEQLKRILNAEQL